jgi:Ran GTPase-activating protein (RanGAP) involved in mRNA processing and transport
MGQGASKKAAFDLPTIPVEADEDTAAKITIERCNNAADLEAALQTLIDKRKGFSAELTRLDLSTKRFFSSADDLAKLSTTFQSLSNVTELNVSGNSLGPEGGQALARSVLPCFPELRILIATGCGLKDEGAKAIAGTLMQMQKLKAIDLKENGITEDGGGASALRTSLSIRASSGAKVDLSF